MNNKKAYENMLTSKDRKEIQIKITLSCHYKPTRMT